MMLKVALVRPPHTYRYNDQDVREDALLTYLLGYLQSVGGTDSRVLDFHLDRSLTFASLTETNFDFYVISVRETGDNVHYGLRIARELTRQLKPVVLYGQTARLVGHPGVPEGAQVCIHDEKTLAGILGLSTSGVGFEHGLVAAPYFQNIGLPPSKLTRIKASLETTRGCHYPCRFCFINAGKNYTSRWLVRPNDAILRDIGTYQSLSVNDVVFNDSEFIGASDNIYESKSSLLAALEGMPTKIRFKIYARADTLLRFAQFDQLRSAGLVSVFLGVESFVQGDLDELKKKLTVPVTEACIQELQRRGIYMDLSFILFNRRTTIQTLRENLLKIKHLYQGMDRHLGLPYFSFSFESSWRDHPVRNLTGRTYVQFDVQMKSPLTQGTAFDPSLEPLMELYRLLNYEWSKKVTALNRSRDDLALHERKNVQAWLSGLGLFCADQMLHLLSRFEAGQLQLTDIPQAREDLFAAINNYNAKLPQHVSGLETYNSHASAIPYSSGASILEPDEYWNDVIPA